MTERFKRHQSVTEIATSCYIQQYFGHGTSLSAEANGNYRRWGLMHGIAGTTLGVDWALYSKKGATPFPPSGCLG